MFKIASIIFYFVRELIFDHRREYDIMSPDFDSRKMIYFALLIVSLSFNGVFIVRSYDLAKESLVCHATIDVLKDEIEILKKEHEVDIDTIKALQKTIPAEKPSKK